MKVLFVASVYRHLTSFHVPYMNYFQEKGYEVWAVGNGDDKEILESNNIKCIDIPFSRNPINISNISAYNLLKKTFQEQHFDLIHVHTPVAAVITRLAFKDSGFGKLIYTAHGFHFFKGAPLKNWLIYYPIEKFAAKWTDHLITINKEDYINAKKLLPIEKVSLVHGVGVEGSNGSISSEKRLELLRSMNIKPDAIIISYIAELNDNKNHQFLLKNWEVIKKINPLYELLIIGTGEKNKELKKIVLEEKLKDIHFLGYRRDVNELLKITDIVTLLSKREGLPKSIMEAMVNGKPCVVSNTRGLRDLVKSNKNGFIVDLNDDSQLVNAFSSLADANLRAKMGFLGQELIQPFIKESVLKEYIEIYSKQLNSK
ncbi:glycosyltransferase family 4 protein [Solibacillus sp. A46]|uniref:Glycosyltransferase family 4 protein n=1 Tax=Solibacillus faecavium TaxID=2762221 RepID=A0ABR8Y0P5_9BACL|nr:glycosyltransferase family 4 protein [Solibacillus faecavium]MBD8037773.1 glycosyltransferase family 4 protein [Solibacillus faecavium]